MTDLPPYDELPPPNASGRHTAQPRARFDLVAFNNFRLSARSAYLVKGILPREGLAVIYGPPKSGKSFFAMDLALHVALGWEYRGRRVQQGAVVYLALEGHGGIAARVEAFRQRHLAENLDHVAFYMITAAADLVADATALIESIRAALGDDCPVLIVIDTVNRSFPGSESRDEDMARYLNAASRVIDAFGCVVALVHHSGIDASRPRGHTSLTAAADVQLAVKRDTAGRVLVEVERMKDGPEGDLIASRLERIEVGNDLDGEPIMSCVVVPDDTGATRDEKRPGKLAPRHRLALDALRDLVIGANPLPASWQLPQGLTGVGADEWREELFRRSIIDRDSANPREPFRRIRHALAAKKLIGERDGLVWIARTD